MNCSKCGAELHPDQKVCIACGARTVAGGGFDYGEEQKWRPSKKMIQGAVAGLALLVLIIVLYNVLHVTPPEEVAKSWFDAMVQRRVNAARDYVTPKFEQDLQTRMMDMRALADEYFTESGTGKYTISEPAYSGSGAGATADVTINTSPGGDFIPKQIKLRMVKAGRAWRINEIQ